MVQLLHSASVLEAGGLGHWRVRPSKTTVMKVAMQAEQLQRRLDPLSARIDHQDLYEHS